MRVELDDMIEEVRQRMGQDKRIRNRVLLEKALSNLLEYKKANEKLL